jgi:hypothetical protein
VDASLTTPEADGEELHFPQPGKARANLTFTNLEQLFELTVGGAATFTSVSGTDLDQQEFFPV